MPKKGPGALQTVKRVRTDFLERPAFSQNPCTLHGGKTGKRETAEGGSSLLTYRPPAADGRSGAGALDNPGFFALPALFPAVLRALTPGSITNHRAQNSRGRPFCRPYRQARNAARRKVAAAGQTEPAHPRRLRCFRVGFSAAGKAPLSLPHFMRTRQRGRRAPRPASLPPAAQRFAGPRSCPREARTAPLPPENWAPPDP